MDDYKSKVPKSWLEHGGVFFPMWQREAMWLGFSSSRRPFAVKVAAGKINAVSGKSWTEELAPSDSTNSGDPRQDYMVAPPQPWLDGFNTGNGRIRQFIAMPLGMGYTVEGQVTGKEEFGGLQIMAIPPKPGLLEPKPKPRSTLRRSLMPQSLGSQFEYNATSIDVRVAGLCDSDDDRCISKDVVGAAEMGLGQGGEMQQKIYPDPHGLDTWDLSASGRLYIHIVNSQMYEQITGEKPPQSPITARDYTSHGYPWYKLWDEEMSDVSSSSTLQGVQTVSQMDQKHGFTGQQDDSSVHETNIVGAGKPLIFGKAVKDGVW